MKIEAVLFSLKTTSSIKTKRKNANDINALIGKVASVNVLNKDIPEG